jgi:hypothetical protein
LTEQENSKMQEIIDLEMTLTADLDTDEILDDEEL